MSLEHTIRLLAGTLILLSFFLGKFVHNNWFFLAVFVGINLVQSSFTKWCLAESILQKYVYK